MRLTVKEMEGELWMIVKDPEKLRMILDLQGVTQRELAMAAGYRAHSHVTRLLKGTAKGLEPEAAIRIAKFLGYQVEDLFVIKMSSEAGRNGQKVPA